MCSRRAGADLGRLESRDRPDPVGSSRTRSSITGRIEPWPTTTNSASGTSRATARHAAARSNDLGLLEHADPSHGRLLRQARERVREGFEVDERREAREGSATGRPLGQIRGAGRHRPDPVRPPKGKQRTPVSKLGERTSPPAPVEPCRGPPVTMQLDHQLGPVRARQPGRGEDHGECLERALGDHHVGPKAPDLGRDGPGKLRVRDHVEEAVPAPSGQPEARI